MAVVGARPNLMKVAPLMREMHCHADIESYLVHTGQHYDSNLSEIFFEELGIPAPDAHLNVGSGSHAEQTARVMLALEPILVDWRPDVVVVVGDVNSTVAAAFVAVKLDIPVAHVEAGLRSFDRTMPEEINRVLTDAIADFLFTPSSDANENLAREGISEDRIFLVGNIMIDSLLSHVERARELDVLGQWALREKQYILVTLHRPSNVDRPESLEGIMLALREVQRRMPVLFPMHPRTRRRLEEFKLQWLVADSDGIRITEPVGYLEFLALMAHAAVVLTDSGGVQEETTVLGTPCLTLRDNTERPITVTQGTNRVIGSDAVRIVPEVEAVLDGQTPVGRVPELWDGRTAERIVEILRQKVTRQDMPPCGLIAPQD